MCRPASFVVAKKEVFWSKNTESHHEIITEFELKEWSVRNQPTIVKIEIVPPDNNYRLPLSKWEYCVDQDILPEWYDKKDVERRCRLELKKWRKAKVILPNERRESIDMGHIVAIYGTVKSIDGGTVEYIRGGTVEYIRGGTVEYIRGGTVKYIDGGTVKSIYGGTVEYIRGGTVEYIRGGTVKSIRGGTVKYIDGGTVKYIDGKFPKKVTGNPTIINYGSLSAKILKSSTAVLIDRTKDPVVCFCGK